MIDRHAPAPQRPVTRGGFGRDEVRAGALIQFSSDIITVLDAAGRVIYSSPAATRLLGYEIGFMKGRSAFELVHPDDVERVLAQFLAELETPGPGEPVEFRMRHADGSWRYVEAVGSNWLDDPTVAGVIINARDVTERVLAEEALRESEERFRGAFEHAPIGMAIADREGRILRCNRALAELVGHSPESLLGRFIRELTHPEDRPTSQAKLAGLFANEFGSYQLEKRYLHADGYPVWVSLNVSAIYDSKGVPILSIGHIQDISERKAVEALLSHQARHDDLTGLANRTAFLERLRDCAQQRQRRIAVLFVDLDHFKVINDSLGHKVGDEVLIAAGERLRRAVRPRDTVARLGGDEFVLLCHDIGNPAAARRTAERVLQVIAEPTPTATSELYVSASVGIALPDGGERDPERLLQDADAAMYRAKQAGRARVAFYEPDLRDRNLDQLQTHAALHRALQRHEFRVHYQPIIDLHLGTIAGFEALLRWQHPERGLIRPGEFIAQAEDSGLIVPIGTWVLEQACQQLARWQRTQKRGLTMSVNLSPRQLTEPSLPAAIGRILRANAIRPDNLWLEITETTLMHDTDAAASTLLALRAKGMHVSIDDFGTGYSSLNYLKRLPIEALKIDQTFVDGLGEDPEDTAIVTGVIRLAHALGLVTTAEGVETRAQLGQLQALQCTYAQGNWLAPAQPARGATPPHLDRRATITVPASAGC